MAGKLTIRRVGNLLPHLCLAGVLLLVGIFVWLSTAGLPGCALRYIEEQAVAAGLPVKLKKIQLQPQSGLAIKAEGIRVEVQQPETAPVVLDIGKIKLIFSLGRLLSGDYTPTQLQVKEGQLTLPLGEQAEDAIKLEAISLQTGFEPEGKRLNATLEAMLQGAALEWKFGLLLEKGIWNELTTEEGTSTPSTDISAEIARYLSEYRPVLQQINTQLKFQEWEPEEQPKIQFSTSFGKSQRIGVTAHIPRYEIAGYHIRQIELDAQYRKETLTVNKLKFETVDPDTKISLQAAYDLSTRELEFHTKSSAPLVRMLSTYLGEDSTGILQQIKADKNSTPSIELNGRADFTEDYALNTFTLRGKVEHNGVFLGRTRVNHALLSFFLHDGSFNIDNLQFDFPEGHLKAVAQAADGKGFAKLDINLPDETLLALARDFSQNSEIDLPTGLSFCNNLKLQVNCDVEVAPFEPGKSHIDDLLPALTGVKLQLNTDAVSYDNISLTNNSLTFDISGIKYDSQKVTADSIRFGLLTSIRQEQTTADAVVFSAELNQLNTDTAFTELRLGKAKLSLSSESATMKTAAVKHLHSTAEFSNMELTDDNLHSDAIAATLHADTIRAAATSASGVHLDIHIPEGLNLADAWHNMQREARVEASVQELRHNDNFCATDTRLVLQNTQTDAATLELSSDIGSEKLQIQTQAALEEHELLRLTGIKAQLPLASLLPLLGNEPLQELKLPRMVEAQGQALIDTKNGTLLSARYDVLLPELVRVCNNIPVFKGREIPLSLHVQGDFRTEADGSMHYDADIDARHKLGRLQIHAAGDPLRECHITGCNSIPVNIINELIDNADAHWIMRDFRCTPGVTQNNITDINTTIRYDRGIYVNARCKAELINMEFLLGALRDKEDAQGNPTGKEYLRTDLGPNPYSLVKKGNCDVEVLVQLDCVDEKGQPLPERIRINLLNPDLLYDNRPWLKRMGFNTGARTSRITGEAVRFNIENSTITLHKLKGNCYPAYSIGMYYAPIQHFLEDVILRDPVDIKTDYCLFPLSRNCKVPMQGLIRAEAPTGAGFRFLGTTIPFTNFSGFINISDVDVYLDRMNAQCWGGVMNGAVRIGFAGEHTTLDGYIQAHTMNLKNIVASYGVDFTPATCSGFIRFQAPQPELEAVQAYGQVSLRDGDLMQLGLFRPIGSLLSDMPGYLAMLQKSVTHTETPKESTPAWIDKVIRYVFDTGSNAIDSMQDSAYKIPFANHFLRYSIDEAFTRFDIINGHLITRNMRARGYNLDVSTQLDINLDKLTLTGNLWPRISSVPTVLISPITVLSKFLIDINLYGDVLAPQWEIGLSKKLKDEVDSLIAEPQNEASPEQADK